jgi:integrase
MGDGLYKRGKIWWIRTDPLTGKEKTTKRRDKPAALAVLRERERLASDPDYAAEAAPCKTLSEWVVRLIDQKKAMRAAATAKFYESKLGHVLRIFGAEAPITLLTPRRFDDYVKQRTAEGARPTTILKEIGCAKVLASEAERLGAFRGNTRLFKPSDLTNDYEPGERFLLPEELPKLLPELSDKRGAHLALAIAIGSRFSESFRILPSHVQHLPATESEPERYLVHVPGTKTKRSRDTIPVAGPLHPLLRAALPFLPLASWSNMTRDLERACARARVPKLTSNDLRRTNASWLIEAGVPDSMVSRLLRHVDERMVRRVYGRARPEKLALAIAAQIATATQTRQLPDKRADQTENHAENTAESPPDHESDQRIENPRVGGSIPSRDTTKNRALGANHAESASSVTCQSVPESDGECQNLPDKNATIRSAPPAFANALSVEAPEGRRLPRRLLEQESQAVAGVRRRRRGQA